MFELRDGRNFSLYNSINEDPFTWKKYNTTLIKNKHQLMELQFNLTDAELLGSADSFSQQPELTSRYQLYFNRFMLNKNAYHECQQNKICQEVVNIPNERIANHFLSKAYSSLESKAMTVS